MRSQECGCGVWEKRANDPFFPIWYNAKTNEYILLFGRIAANAVTIIFCPSCGGRMPKSRRGDLFTIPIDEELTEARALLEQVNDVDAMRSLLGEPDAVFDGFKDEYGEPLRNPDGPDLIRQYTLLFAVENTVRVYSRARGRNPPILFHGPTKGCCP